MLLGGQNGPRDLGVRTPLLGSSASSDNAWVKNASAEVRMGFVRKVYALLSVQLLLTFVVAALVQSMSPTWRFEHQWLMALSMIATMATLCAMSCCRDVCREYPKNYCILFAFTFFEGILLGFISSEYTAGSVTICVGVTAAIFMGLTVYAWTTTTDFTGYGPYLYGALMAFMMFGFAMSIMSMFGIYLPSMTLMYNFCGVVIFVMYIVFDTQMILGDMGGHEFQFGIDDYVFAALTLYLDIVNLFLYLLRFFGERKN